MSVSTMGICVLQFLNSLGPKADLIRRGDVSEVPGEPREVDQSTDGVFPIFILRMELGGNVAIK